MSFRIRMAASTFTGLLVGNKIATYMFIHSRDHFPCSVTYLSSMTHMIQWEEYKF